MQDKYSEKRFIIALLISILIHLLIIFLIYAFEKLTYVPKAQLTKIDPSNLLILKRGQSQDKTKNTQGAPRPSLAANNSPQPHSTPNQMPSYPSSTPPQRAQSKESSKENSKDIHKQQKKQKDSQNKALQKYQKDYIDPKNLSLLSKQQILALQNPSFAARSGQNDKGMDPQTQKDINELYGEEFGDLGSAQKDFIKNNLRNIGRITQSYLQYPREAAYLGQDGQNAIEFYLHPNGDITDLKIIQPSGSIILDKNTTKTIEIAYKDYPRPTTTTLIRIRVRYFMYR